MLPLNLYLKLELPLLLIDNPYLKALHGQSAGHPSRKPPFQNICSWSSEQYSHDVFIQHENGGHLHLFFSIFSSASWAWGERTRDWGVGPGKRILIFNDPWIEESIWNKSIQCQFKNFFVPFEFEPQWYSIIFMVLRWVISSQASGQTPGSISGTRWLEKCRACLCCTCLNSTKTDNSNF